MSWEFPQQILFPPPTGRILWDFSWAHYVVIGFSFIYLILIIVIALKKSAKMS